MPSFPVLPAEVIGNRFHLAALPEGGIGVKAAACTEDENDELIKRFFWRYQRLNQDEFITIQARLDDIARRLDGMVVSPWLTSRESAGYLRCSPRKIETLTGKGLLPFSRQDPTIPKSPRLYHRSHLDAYLLTGKNIQTQRLTPEEKKLIKQLTL